MKAQSRQTLAVALLSIALLGAPGLRGVAAAQAAVTRIAYDQCWADVSIWDLVCSIGVVSEGYDSLVADGMGPKWSPDGSKIAFTGANAYTDPNFGDILVLNLADGSITNLTSLPASNWGPVWSRDGGRIAFVSDRDGAPELYVMQASGANPTRVTHHVGFSEPFAWSPANDRFAFASDRDGPPELYVTDADGSNLTRLTNNVGFQGPVPGMDRSPLAWSPDGSRIAFDCLVDGGADICAINGDGTNFVRLTTDPAKDWGAVFSPVNGRIAFVTERYGTGPEIAVLDEDGAVTRVAGGTGGAHPVWSPDGNRLIFVSTIPSFYTGVCYFGGGAHNADDFCLPVYGIYLVNADGSGLTAIASGARPDWFRSGPGQPVAAFTHECSGVTCDFDAAGSFDPDGTIASYLWRFGDGTSSSGPTAHHVYATGDRYAVELTVADDGGASGGLMKRIWANAAPVVSFTVACTDSTCTFDGSASSDPDGTIASYTWDFGDENWAGSWNGAGATVSHKYRTGTFSPRLIVADNSGTTGTAVRTLSVVYVPPVATFTSTCNGLICTFDGSGSSDPAEAATYYLWSFGDGTIWRGAIASHTYNAGGTYPVTLTVDDYYGERATQSRTISVATVNVPPVASFTSACSGLTCSFNAAGSSDSDGTIASYAWTLGDGTSGSGSTVSRTYAAGGSYTVTLTVTDNRGAGNQTTHVVSVNAPPVASFTSACSGLTCSFNASGSSDPDGTITSYVWNFGDATTGSGATASHSFAAGGSYTVTLTVTDNAAAPGQAVHAVTVTAPNAPPVASFTFACNGLTCSFNASGSSDSDGTIVSYAWTFGDATSGSASTVSHTFAAGGTYTVALTVTDNGTATGAQVQSLTVVSPTMHVGDLDRASTMQQNAWTANVTITVHTSSHAPLANAVVSAAWNGGSTGSCTTNASGRCSLARSGIPKNTGSVSFTVTNVALATFVYKPANNHDPDGDSNGTTISVSKP